MAGVLRLAQSEWKFHIKRGKAALDLSYIDAYSGKSPIQLFTNSVFAFTNEICLSNILCIQYFDDVMKYEYIM